VATGSSRWNDARPEPASAAGPDEAGTLLIRTPIASRFDDARLGELRLRFDWGQVNDILDRAAGDDRMVAVVDAGGRLVAASQSLRKRGLTETDRRDGLKALPKKTAPMSSTERRWTRQRWRLGSAGRRGLRGSMGWAGAFWWSSPWIWRWPRFTGWWRCR
jgi:rhodanese-related sulfurtransferase